MNSRVVPVVVVGAGPTGVTAATLLAKQGVDVLVLDRWSDVFPQPRAVHLDDEIYRILARIGVAEEFAHISRPAQGLRLQDARHRVFAEFRRDGSTGRHGYPQANMFDQPDLETLLRANMKKHEHVRFRGDVEVTAVHQGADVARIDLRDCSTGESEAIEASYVLGCDGANSVTRRSIGSTMRDLRFDQRWLVVDVNTEQDLGQWEGVHQVCDTDRAATFMRIGDRRYRWEFQLKDDETSDDFTTTSALKPLIGPWTGRVPDGELELVRVAEYTFRAQVADRWRDRRVFILGDAAHLTPPFIGQGMGAGLRDAANLTWKLAGVVDGSISEAVLDSYQQERRPHARTMILMAIIVGAAMTSGGRAGDWLRRLVAPRLHLVPGMRERILDGSTPALGRGALVARGLRPGGLAGSLCPNAMIDPLQRLDDLTGGRFALVTTAELEPTQENEAASRGFVVVDANKGTQLATWLESHRAVAALVRPDGAVMASSHSIDALLAVANRRLSRVRGH